MGIEATMGEARRLHHARDRKPVRSLFAQLRRGRLQQRLVGFVLVRVGVAHALFRTLYDEHNLTSDGVKLPNPARIRPASQGASRVRPRLAKTPQWCHIDTMNIDDLVA